jgi:diguanylate cyclase (GGDEF)-like protein
MADDSRNREFPWETAARTRQPVLGTFMNLRKTTGAIAKLMVNATPIFNGDDIGGVMLTFDDVTMLQQKNEQLNSANAQLRQIKNQVTAQNEQLRILASTDGLTGCLNRRTFFVEAEKMVADARSRGYATAALMLDIDHFKRINDQYGHPAGDAVLAAVGQMMRNKFGNYGIVARYGGEEFAVMFAGLASNHIRELAEQLRNTVSAVDSWLPDQKRVTVSIGFAMLKEPALTVEDVVKIADEALYKAKHEGRNRVVEGKADLPLVA